MNRIVFVTGGSRSGKSDVALNMAESAGGELFYLATATSGDAEMAERIRRHQAGRKAHWKTIEEPIKLVEAISAMGHGSVVLVDCLTLWVTNLMMKSPEPASEEFESATRQKAELLAKALKVFNGTVILVSNEIGMGIVPDNPMTRRFRDTAGAINRIIAQAAGEVYLVVSGIPVRIK